MATGETKKITGSLSLEDRYQTTIYDDILTISGANISLLDPAGEIFTDKGNDTVTVTNSTITNNSETGAELMFSMGSDNDSLTISNSTLNVNTFMGSGDDYVTVSGSVSSTVTINNQFSLGSGNDTLILKAQLKGSGALVFGDGNDTLVFDGGALLTTGSISGFSNLTVNHAAGTLGSNLTLYGTSTNITYNGNLTGTDANKVITIADSNTTLNTSNNAKTNVAFSLSNVIFNHVGIGTLEIAENGGWAFTADNSTVTIHDAVLRSNYGGITGTGTIWTISKSDISSNTNGGAFITGGDVAFSHTNFTSNTKFSSVYQTGQQFVSASAGAVAVTSSQDYGSSTLQLSPAVSSIVKGAGFYGTESEVNASFVLFEKNEIHGDSFSYTSGFSTAYARTTGSFRATSIAQALANPIASSLAQGGACVLKSNSISKFHNVNFSDNKSFTTATATATGKATASAYGVYAVASSFFTAAPRALSRSQGGALYIGNCSTTDICDAIFKNNTANATASSYASATSDKMDAFDAIPKVFATAHANALAQGGAIAVAETTVNITSTQLAYNTSFAKASSMAFASAGGISAYLCTASAMANSIAKGGAIYTNSATVTLNDSLLSDNVVIASSFASAYSSTSGYYSSAFVYSKTPLESSFGGAIYANGGILNLNNVTFQNNIASAITNSNSYSQGGAVYVSDNVMTYVVDSDIQIRNIGNQAGEGGFIYLGNASQATFQVNGELIVGDSTDKDSIAGDSTSTIIKTGNGTWTINSDISGFAGYWNVNSGSLKLIRIARNITLDNWTIGVDAKLQLSALNDTISMNADK